MMFEAGSIKLPGGSGNPSTGVNLMSKAMSRYVLALGVLGLTVGAAGVARGDVVIASNLASSPSYSSFDLGIGRILATT